MEAYLENVKAKTGKSWQDFKTLAEAKGLKKHGEIVAWLKADFELGHGHAGAVAHMILNSDAPKVTDDDALAQHFTGAKAAWRAPFDALVQTLNGFGADVKLSTGKSYISLQRGEKKFGVVQVSGKRMDIGIKLKGTPATGRYEESGAWNAMVTHRVQIGDASQIDADLIDWLHKAYGKA